MEQQNQTVNPQAGVTPPPSVTSKNYLPFVLLGGVLLFAVVGSGAFLLGQKSSEKPITAETNKPSTTITPSIKQLSPEELVSNPTVNWKTYSGSYFTFKYPTELDDATEGGLETQVKEITVIYLSPGKNKPQSDLSDGYMFKVVYGPLIGTGTIDEVAEKQIFNTKENCPDAIISTPTNTNINGERALIYSVNQCLGDYSNIIVSKGTRVFLITELYPGDNSNHDYRRKLDQILSTFKFTDQKQESGIINGSELKDIKYQLPTSWEAKLTKDSLMLSPTNGGGYLSINVFDYTNNIGRREYYCQARKICINGTTYYTEMKIGNIDGYKANALDNSGGGAEYFGVKGNKFYVIASYNPPLPNEFEKTYLSVLNSLVF